MRKLNAPTSPTAPTAEDELGTHRGGRPERYGRRITLSRWPGDRWHAIVGGLHLPLAFSSEHPRDMVEESIQRLNRDRAFSLVDVDHTAERHCPKCWCSISPVGYCPRCKKNTGTRR